MFFHKYEVIHQLVSLIARNFMPIFNIWWNHTIGHITINKSIWLKENKIMIILKLWIEFWIKQWSELICYCLHHNSNISRTYYFCCYCLNNHITLQAIIIIKKKERKKLWKSKVKKNEKSLQSHSQQIARQKHSNNTFVFVPLFIALFTYALSWKFCVRIKKEIVKQRKKTQDFMQYAYALFCYCLIDTR